MIGHCSRLSDLVLADAAERYLVPPARDAAYEEVLLELLSRTRPDLLYVTHDFEIQAISRLREQITALGVELFLPCAETVEACIDKYRSYLAWRRHGLPVPETTLIASADEIAGAIAALGPTVWIRCTEGGGGAGSLATSSAAFAREWLSRHAHLGHFTVARCLTPESITWTSLWREGTLVAAQTRRRGAWAFGSRVLSGVSGATQIATTCRNAAVDEIAEAAITAIDPAPHGIFSVDLTFDDEGAPNPTEINIGRFFTTIDFFTRAGLNFPGLFRDAALTGSTRAVQPRVNPLPDGLVWVRGMDREPVLTTEEDLRAFERAATPDRSPRAPRR
ncbi:MAG: carboxylate--amine ligase [Thermoleophilaceae bacterium]